MSSSPFALRVSLIADLIKLVTETPGISTGTETKGILLCALSSGANSRRSSSKMISPSVTS
jgi:hypothetical protein